MKNKSLIKGAFILKEKHILLSLVFYLVLGTTIFVLPHTIAVFFFIVLVLISALAWM